MTRNYFIVLSITFLLFIFSSCEKDADMQPDNLQNNTQDTTQTTPQDTTTGGGTTTDPQAQFKAKMLDLINQTRTQGCLCGGVSKPAVAAVTWDDLLEQAAVDHSTDMSTNNFFSHTGSNGSTAGQRITATGYNWTTYNENIASGQTTEEQVVNAWLNSTGHCNNIMQANVQHMGVGRIGNLWTLVMAKSN